jgi:ABC-type Fe3+-hydroxamate transport system substrate-binding protein
MVKSTSSLSMLFTDQMQRSIRLSQWPPQRIVSLVPSQTELLYDLGLGERVVGITKFCVHPADWFQSKQRIGGTKTVHFEKIAALEPDLIIGNKEENVREQIEALAERYPVWMSDVVYLEDALTMIESVGQLTNTSTQAMLLTSKIKAAFAQWAVGPTALSSRPRVAYLIWRKPWMLAASGTFIHTMLQQAGFDNAFVHLERYPEVSAATLAEATPDYILLSSEPFPFQGKHITELHELCPDSHIRLVDGEMFSWYGSRLQHFPKYISSWMEV